MLTVFFATKNRAQTLEEVLGAFSLVQAPPGGWKLVVVDNGSTDQTTEVVQSFAGRLPVHGLSEPTPGKNIALNTGLSLLEGDLAVFTDDDVFPRADWLIELRKAADSHPDFTMFGGAVFPRWEVPPPPWIRWVTEPLGSQEQISEVRVGPVFTLTDPAQKEGLIPPSVVFGPNMAVRASAFQSGMRFDPSIGPRGSSYPMGSETELLLRLDRKGQKAWYAPGAVVEHFIRKEQLERSWVLQRAVRFGRGHYRLSSRERLSNARLMLRMPLHLLRRLSEEGIRMAVASATLQKEAFFRAQWRFNFFRGESIEVGIQVRERLAGAAPSEV